MATSKTRPSSRGPAPRPGEGFGPPTKSANVELKRRARAQDKELAAVYEAGRKEGAKGTGGGGGRKTSSSRRRPVPGARSARAAAGQLQAPVRAQVTSGLRIVGVSLALVALYNILVPPGPEAFTGVLGGLSRALTWLSAPTPFPKRS